MKRVRIKCDENGVNSYGFSVTDLDTGQPIERIVSVEIEPMDCKSQFPRARIVVNSAEIDIEAEARIVVGTWPAKVSDETRNILHCIAEERGRQAERWGNEHDDHHEGFEWLGLIARYAAAGEYVKAAAVAVAAEEARHRALIKRWDSIPRQKETP